MSVADDGGSSGRLRRDLGVPPPGDIRRCLVALAGDDSVWSAAFEHRFRDGELEGHALGNLVLVGLTETLGSFPDALDEAGRLLRTVGRVLPGHRRAGRPQGGAGRPRGRGPGRGGEQPRDPPGRAGAGRRRRHGRRGGRHRGGRPGGLRARVALHQRAAGAVRGRAPATRVASTPAEVVQVANLRPQVPETAGMDAADHLEAVLAHGARVDRFLYDTRRRPRGRSRAGSGHSGWNRWRARVGPARRPGPRSRTVGEGTPCSAVVTRVDSDGGGNQWRFV